MFIVQDKEAELRTLIQNAVVEYLALPGNPDPCDLTVISVKDKDALKRHALNLDGLEPMTPVALTAPISRQSSSLVRFLLSS